MAMLVYVDDMVVATRHLQGVIEFKCMLRKAFNITDLGELKHILGIQVQRDCAAHMIRLDQSTYIQGLLTHHGMGDSTPIATPVIVKEQLTSLQCLSH